MLRDAPDLSLGRTGRLSEGRGHEPTIERSNAWRSGHAGDTKAIARVIWSARLTDGNEKPQYRTHPGEHRAFNEQLSHESPA
jgi:hypothetical protein